jgi:hypothetical protein
MALAVPNALQSSVALAAAEALVQHFKSWLRVSDGVVTGPVTALLEFVFCTGDCGSSGSNTCGSAGQKATTSQGLGFLSHSVCHLSLGVGGFHFFIFH